ncbi:amidase signature domain-containing protein [Podospora didyma]|uniref:Amidase signature domain-containing protein n=1 Tax=Podospora didyma TaxID=330526 RepID=A0AAE0P5V3_9PEZI|nr:amidase signature domain-containing protein [Podospora didyma]
MASAKRFANYPGAKEAPAAALEYKPEEDKNPALRGLALVVVATAIANSTWLQKWLWSNAKLGQPKLTPGLAGVVRRMHPNVIPLADGTVQTSSSMLELGAELRTPQPTNLAGRFNSVADYHEAYRSGEVTPLQVAEALLPLIRRDIKPEPSKYAVAWLQTNVDEVLAAAKASTERWAAGKPLGVLDGVPFGVKDDLEVKGFVSTMGMKVNKSEPYFNTPQTETVWPVQKLQEAGGIMMGKMNQHEVGMDTTGCNPTTGTAVNWANPSYYPGGSSSGAGSAVSGGLVPIAIGTDAGGSIRIPPAFCGVYGLKPTHNRTCTRASTMCVVGPACATAADLAIAYRIMAQPNPSHPDQGHFALSVPPSSSPSQKKYLGICREWVARSDADVLAVFDKAVHYLTSTLGYETVDIKLPYLREGKLAHAGTCVTEAADDAKARSSRGAANYLSLLSLPNRMLVGAGAQTPAADYLKYTQIRQVIMSHLAFLYEKYPDLLILTPTTPLAGMPIHPGDQKYGFSDGNNALKSMTYVWLANSSGCPAVSCPAGFVEPAQGDGRLPVGLMAMAEWGAEEQLLAFARDTETYLNETYPGGRVRPAQWADVLGLAKAGKGTATATAMGANPNNTAAATAGNTNGKLEEGGMGQLGSVPKTTTAAATTTTTVTGTTETSDL